MSNGTSNLFYEAMKDAVLNHPLEVMFYRDVMRPCRHRRARVWWDRATGHYHPREHLVSEAFTRVALMDKLVAENDETITMEWDATGAFRITE